MSIGQLRHGPVDRYRRVVQVLVHHGFEHYVVDQLGLGHLLPISWGMLRGHRRPKSFTRGERLRLALEELGTTYIKLGQILSTRSDLLAPDLIAELSKLQNDVPPEPLSVVEAQITAELGKAPEALFTHFDPQPLGSASIGQVHAAKLLTGEEVVVKVRRSGVERLVEADLAVLMDLARLAQTRTAWGKVYDLPAMVHEFADTLRAELDYVREGRNAERIARNYSQDSNLRVPKIFWPYTTKRVLTMERIDGIKINDLAALDAAGIDRHKLAVKALRIVLKMILEDGFFHADPHPGNFLIGPRETIGLVDFGMVGSLDEQTRENLLHLLAAVVEHDIDRILDRMSALGIVGTTFQLDHLKQDLEHLISLYWGLPLKEMDTRRMLEEFMLMVRRRELSVPAHLVLMIKTLNMHEGLARQLDPEITLTDLVPPYVRQLAAKSYLPQRWGKRVLPAVLDLSQLMVTLPRRADRLLGQAERGTTSVSVRVQETEHVLDSLNRMVNRLILGILTASATIGIALLLQLLRASDLRSPIFEIVSALLAAGFLAAVTMALWLTLGILRRGHH